MKLKIKWLVAVNKEYINRDDIEMTNEIYHERKSILTLIIPFLERVGSFPTMFFSIPVVATRVLKKQTQPL